MCVTVRLILLRDMLLPSSGLPETCKSSKLDRARPADVLRYWLTRRLIALITTLTARSPHRRTGTGTGNRAVVLEGCLYEDER